MGDAKVPDKILIFVSLILPFNVSVESNNIDFSGERLAKELLLESSWTCHMVDTHGEGPGIWTFTSVQGDTVKDNIVIP